MGCPKGVKSNLKRMEWEVTDCCNIYVLEAWILSRFNTGKQKCNKKKKNEKGLLQDNREL